MDILREVLESSTIRGLAYISAAKVFQLGMAMRMRENAVHMDDAHMGHFPQDGENEQNLSEFFCF